MTGGAAVSAAGLPPPPPSRCLPPRHPGWEPLPLTSLASRVSLEGFGNLTKFPPRPPPQGCQGTPGGGRGAKGPRGTGPECVHEEPGQRPSTGH